MPPTHPLALCMWSPRARYRGTAIEALRSAQLFFGGDCLPTFFLLTENITGVDSTMNPTVSPYREW
jgi:hypothetical protein